jgi:hypothetical protein
MIHACLGCNSVAIQHLTGITSLIKEMSLKSISSIYPAHCIDKTILRYGGNDFDHISEEDLKSCELKITAQNFCEDTFPNGVSYLILYIPVYFLL